MLQRVGGVGTAGDAQHVLPPCLQRSLMPVSRKSCRGAMSAFDRPVALALEPSTQRTNGKSTFANSDERQLRSRPGPGGLRSGLGRNRATFPETASSPSSDSLGKVAGRCHRPRMEIGAAVVECPEPSGQPRRPNQCTFKVAAAMEQQSKGERDAFEV